MTRTDAFVTVDGTEVHYTDWGARDDPLVVCVHGLSRNGRDFDPLARRLVGEGYRVVCPDMPGRGLSEWADDPETEYSWEGLLDTLREFCETFEREELRYVGTSMGGLLGMLLADDDDAVTISHFVCNDIGPVFVHAEDGIERIVDYLTDPPTFDTYTGLEDWYRETYGTMNAQTDAEWRRFTLTSARRRDDGRVTRAYDERIVAALLRSNLPPEEAWGIWESLDLPTFVIWGRESDVLTEPTVEEMLERRPDIDLLELDCGHPPGLNVAEQLDPVVEFLAD
ncbi:alpha/beta fold hydrolase [Haloarchaeobius baliensis]|uniref:alpha/beta fold hydrolase n=1 Tax=Haloarchaeobius baliensis TaxID=1670458 RepID=UPI003F883780